MNQDPLTRADRMRTVLGHFATGVVVVTAADDRGPLGFTCQSFASLSLDPALVLVCPARTSTTWPRIRRLGCFCINILAAEQEQLSRRFARSGPDKYVDSSWSRAPSGSPVFEGVAAWVDCTVRDEFDGGDHTIVVGEVHALDARADSQPLVYHRGAYSQLSFPSPRDSAYATLAPRPGSTCR